MSPEEREMIMGMLKGRPELIFSELGRESIYASIKKAVEENHPGMSQDEKIAKASEVIGEVQSMITEILVILNGPKENMKMLN
tara:strand:- start:1134 stop:1382 length:249 start_codon:yes stop_codon:yes gene_type:complete